MHQVFSFVINFLKMVIKIMFTQFKLICDIAMKNFNNNKKYVSINKNSASVILMVFSAFYLRLHSNHLTGIKIVLIECSIDEYVF